MNAATFVSEGEGTMLKEALRTMPLLQDDGSLDVDKILEDVDSEIIRLAGIKVPRNAIRPEIVPFEIDDLAQDTRIKLWRELNKGHVRNPRAYAYCITGTLTIDRVRKFTKVSFFPLDTVDVLAQEEVTTGATYRMQDPAIMYEEKEAVEMLVEAIAKGLSLLPPQQQHAALCMFKKKAIIMQPLLDAFLKYGLDIEAVYWPETREEQQRIRASYLVARRKLKEYLQREGENECIPSWYDDREDN